MQSKDGLLPIRPGGDARRSTNYEKSLHLVSGFAQGSRNFQLLLAAENSDLHGVSGAMPVR